MSKPSERVKEIHDALMVVDNKDPLQGEAPNPTYWERAIIKALDELRMGSSGKVYIEKP